MNTTDTAPIVDTREPWLGLASYRESDSRLFFGRDRESAEILRLVRRETLTVLFGASGTGKTSLLNAGLSPQLRANNFLPIYIRLGHSAADPEYVVQIRNRISEAAREHNMEEQPLSPPFLGREETLWEYSHRTVFWDRRNNPITTVLVLDQFEEVFTLGQHRADRDALLVELTDLVENYVPARLLQPTPFLHDESRSKVVLSLREDYLYHLDSLRKTMPSVMQNRLSIGKMSREQAILAVREPGRGIIDDDVARRIVRFVSGADESFDQQVEPALLSVVCRELNARRIEAKREFITEDLLEQAGSDILDDFYERAFAGLKPATRTFVEDRLLTRGGFRNTVPLEEASIHGSSEDEIRTLIDRRLLRTEERLGVPHLELSHDLLTTVVQKSRDQRHIREQEERTRQELRRARSRLLIATSVAFVCLCLAVLAFFFWVEARANQKEAKVRELAADSIESLAEDPERSILLSMHAFNGTLGFPQVRVPAAEDALHRAILSSYVRGTIRGHSDRVTGVAFSPDVWRVATASTDKTAKIWDAASGRGIVTLTGHSGGVTSVAFSPDAKQLATGSRDNTAKIWDAASAKELATLRGHSGTVTGVAFSRDGRRAATSSEDKTAKVWDVASGKELLTLRGHSAGVSAVAFSPDGKRVATGSADNTTKVWDVRNGKELLTLRGHSAAITAVAFSRDGRYLGTASWDHTAKVWDAPGGVELSTYEDRSSREVLGIAFTPDGERIATASGDGTAKIWRVGYGQMQGFVALRGHSGAVTSVAFSPDGKRLATSSEDKLAELWDTGGSQEWLTLTDPEGLRGAVFAPDDQRIGAGSGDKAKLWDATTGTLLLVLKGHRMRVNSLAFSPNGRHVATSSEDGTAKLWDMGTGGELLTLDGHSGAVHSIAYNSDGRRVATASSDHTVKIWDVTGGKDLLTIDGHKDVVNCATFSPDGKRLATASFDQTAKVWDSDNGQELLTIRGHTDAVNCVAFSPDSTRVATASKDKTAKVWDVATGKELLTLRGHGDWVFGVTFSPDGKRLATASRDRTARVWDASNGQELLNLRGHSGEVWSAVFNSDGTRLVTSGEDGAVQVFAADSRDLLSLARSRVTRSLTLDECKRYFRRETCPALP